MTDTHSSAANLSDLSTRMRSYVERGDVPGLVYAVDNGGKLAVEAIGERTIDGPVMTRDTIFRIASMTKPVVAAAAMSLVDEERLQLDEPVDQFLPELSERRVLRAFDSPLDDTVPAVRAITLRHLLTLTWGLGVVIAPPRSRPIQVAIEELELGDGPPNPANIPEPDEWMRRLGSLPLMHQPGEGWVYNMGSDVLGILISRAAGKSLESVLSERIFDPLGMTDTGFSVPASKFDRFATSYGVDPDSGSLVEYDNPRGGQWSRPPGFQSGASGLVSTVDDYLAFARMLLNKGEHRGHRVLSTSSVDLMTTDYLTPEQRESGQPILEVGTGWGFGMAVVAEPGDIPCSIGTYGWNGGLGTTWSNDPVTRISAVLLTQVNWTSPTFPAISREFLTAAFQLADA